MRIYILPVLIFGFNFSVYSSSISSFQDIFSMEEECEVKPIYLFLYKQDLKTVLEKAPSERDVIRDSSPMIINIIKMFNPSNSILEYKEHTQILKLQASFSSRKYFFDFTTYLVDAIDTKIRNLVSIDKIHDQMKSDILRCKVSHSQEALDEYLKHLSVLSERIFPQKLKHPPLYTEQFLTSARRTFLWPINQVLEKIYRTAFCPPNDSYITTILNDIALGGDLSGVRRPCREYDIFKRSIYKEVCDVLKQGILALREKLTVDTTEVADS